MRQALAIVLLVVVSCASTAPTADEEAYVRGFLDVWLVAGNIEQAKTFLSPSFRPPTSQQSPESFPTAMQNLSETERALTFALQCSGTTLNCSDLAQCVRPLPGSVSLFERQRVPVTKQLVEEFPAVADLGGREVTNVALRLRVCNVGVLILMDRTNSRRRVRSVMYLAP